MDTTASKLPYQQTSKAELKSNDHGQAGMGQSRPEESTDKAVRAVPGSNSKYENKTAWSSLFVFLEKQELCLLVTAIGISAVSAGGKTVYAVVIGKIFDIVAGFGSRSLDAATTLSRVSYWCLILTVLGLARWLVNALFMSSWIILGESRARASRKAVFRALLDKDMSWYDALPDGVASLTSGVQAQIRELQLATSQILGQLVNDTFLTLGALALAFYSSWKLSLVMLATVPPSVVVISLVTRGLQPAIQAYRQELSKASRHAATPITAIELVKVYNGVDNEVWQYIEAVRRASQFALRQAMRNSLQIGYVKAWLISLFVVGFWFAIYLVNRGEIAPGQALTAFYAVLIAFQALENLGPQFSTVAKGVGAGKALGMLVRDLNIRPCREQQRGHRLAKSPTSVILHEVAFAYPSTPAKPVLRPSTLFFPHKEMSFIVGRSGSGKSTIASLLVKFYEPTHGTILVDGMPLSALEDRWVRQNILLVQQTSTLFKDTFFQNVAVGSLDPDGTRTEQVREALEFALLQSTVMGLPNGLDTQIGPGGVALSGGQRQRLALARARLRDPPILILDEITSGLDPTNASMLMDAIRIWRRGKTTIIITHDISQIRADEYIHVMEQGALVQGGYFGQLAEQNDGAIQEFLRSATTSPRNSSIRLSHHGMTPELHEDEHVEHSILSRFIFSHADQLGNHQGMFRPMSIIAPRFSTAGPLVYEIRDTPKLPQIRPRSSMDILEENGRAIQGRRPQGSIRRQQTISMSAIAGVEEAPPAKTSNAKSGSVIKVLASVWPMLDRFQRLSFVIGIILCLVVAGLTPAFSYVFAELLACFWTLGDKEAAARPWAIDLTIIALADGATSFLAYLLMARVSQAWIDGLRIEAHKRILRQPKAWFDEPSHSSHQIVQFLDSRADELGKLVAIFLPIVLVAAGMVIASIIWALSISWKLSLFTLATGPAVYLAARLAAYISNKWEARCIAAGESTGSLFAEVFSNIRVVRALTLEEYFGKQFKSSCRDTFRAGVKRSIRTGAPYGLNQSMSDWLTALVFYYATVLLTSGDLSIGGVQKVVNLLLFSIGNATVMLGDIPQIVSAKSTAGEILNLARLPPGAGHEQSGRLRPQTLFPIHMNSLKFAYPSGPQSRVLHGVDLSIEAGEAVAIVGPSGCGKSTLASMLLRLYEPLDEEGGSSRHPFDSRLPPPTTPLSYGGYDARDIHTGFLRSKVGYVSQHPFIFPGTVRENILYGMRDDAPERRLESEAVVHAARAAGIHELIVSLSEGYDTRIGEGGVGLSGGESQRVSIARALVRKPKLMVLDEPTSALDAVAADGIRDLIRHLITADSDGNGRSMAVVVVTHSREMMQVVDRVVMLQDGQVVETGSYEQLVRRGHHFAEFIRRE